MSTIEEYEKYAGECERLAQKLPKEHRETMLNIAKAWRSVAEEARRREGKTRST
jgi:hypothetical protein